MKRALIVWSLALLLTAGASAALAITSGDAYITDTGAQWKLGTSTVEKIVALESGKFLLKSFKDKTTGYELLPSGVSSDEFFVTASGIRTSGSTGSWTLVGANAEKLSQGELQLDVTLSSGSLQVTKSYMVYPSSSIIREWVKFTNTGQSSMAISDPGFLNVSMRPGDPSTLDFLWLTGGENIPGSWDLRTETLTTSAPRRFDSDETFPNGTPGTPYPRASSASYAPWNALYARDTKQGLFIGWDYFGHWASSYSLAADGTVTAQFKIAGHSEYLWAGKSLTTPKAFIGLYRDDLDNAGNECLDWQYRYLWDYTRDGWFPAIRYAGEWIKGTTWGQTWSGSGGDFKSIFEQVFMCADFQRTVGADTYHRDWGWWGIMGDWDGPNWRAVNDYLRKHKMGLLLYGFLYAAEAHSAVGREHPDWFLPDGRNIDLARPEVVEFMKGKLDEWYENWGPFEWRNDGGFTAQRVPGDDTVMLAQDQGFRKVLKDFLDKHPDCAFQSVNGGGVYAGYDYTRFSSSFSFSDGQVGMLRNHYASLMLPPDKTSDIPEVLGQPDHYDKATWRGILCTNFGLSQDSMDRAKIDGVRQIVDIYHYLQSKGVVGRWVKVYRPRITGDDPTMYFQRLSGNRLYGVIIPKRPAPGPVTIKPKGLLPQQSYNVSYQESTATQSRTGDDLMTNGIVISSMLPGELIYLNLPMHPGSTADGTPPTAPINLTKRWGDNMGFPGVELSWTASTDNNWVSYYEVLRNGVVTDKVAKGVFYFDHSAGADLAANYQVRAVDGSGHTSALTVATGPTAVASRVVDDAPGAGITFSSGWQPQSGSSFWPAHAGTLTSSGQSGSTADLTFNGKKILWFTKLGANCGKAQVIIDGVVAATIDTYSADDIWGVCLFRKEFPEVGQHTIRIKVLGEHNARSTDNVVHIDGFRVEMAAPQTPPSAARSLEIGLHGSGGAITALAVDQGSSEIYAMRPDARISKYDRNGNLMATFGPTIVDSAGSVRVSLLASSLMGMAVDPVTGYLYVANSGLIHVMDARSGSAIWKRSINPGMYGTLQNISFTDDGQVLYVAGRFSSVTSERGARQLVRANSGTPSDATDDSFTVSGVDMKTCGIMPAVGYLDPRGCAVDRNGRVYVADYGSVKHPIRMYAPGEDVADMEFYAATDRSWTVSTDIAGRVWMNDIPSLANPSRMIRCFSTGSEIYAFDPMADGGRIAYPLAVACDRASGRLIVAGLNALSGATSSYLQSWQPSVDASSLGSIACNVVDAATLSPVQTLDWLVASSPYSPTLYGVGLHGLSASSGNYSCNVKPGLYSIRASAPGYLDGAVTHYDVSPNATTTTMNVQLLGSGTDRVSISMGDHNLEQGLFLRSTAPGANLGYANFADFKTGMRCRGFGRPESGSDESYMSFDVDDSFIHKGSPGSGVWVEVASLDDGPDRWGMELDTSVGGYTGLGWILKNGSGSWKTSKFWRPDGYLGNREPWGTDMRLVSFSNDAGNGLPAGADYVAGVTVRKSADASWYEQIGSISDLKRKLVGQGYGSVGSINAGGHAVDVRGKVVVGSWSGYFYIEEDDRSSGIRVVSDAMPEVGSVVNVTGNVSAVPANQELCLLASSVTVTGGRDVPGAVGLSGKWAAGGPESIYWTVGGESYAFQSQPGVLGGIGRSNVGLLVKIWGTVTAAGTYTNGDCWAYVDDGSSVIGETTDYGNEIGVKVQGGGISLPQVGSRVAATGVMSMELGDAYYYPVVLMRNSDDMRVFG